MKRLRSYGDDLDSVGEKGGGSSSCKDWERRDRDRDRDRERDRDLDRSSSRRFFGEGGSSRSSRKRYDYDVDGFDRRKSSDRYRESLDRGVIMTSPRNGYVSERERIHRSESFSSVRREREREREREFPKGYVASERERTRREETVSSWRRLCVSKDTDEEYKSSADRGNRVLVEDRMNVRSPQQGIRDSVRSPQSLRDFVRSPQGSRDVVKSSPSSKDSGGEQSRSGEAVPRGLELELVRGEKKCKSSEVKKSDEVQGESGSSSEMEEGELEPEPETKSITDPDNKTKLPCTENSESEEVESDKQMKLPTDLIVETESLPEKKLDLKTESVFNEIERDRTLETVTFVSKGIVELQECHENFDNQTNSGKETAALVKENEAKEENNSGDHDSSFFPGRIPEEQLEEEELKDGNAAKSMYLDEGTEEKNDVDLVVQADEINFVDTKELTMEDNRKSQMTLNLMADTPNGKDKGKSIAVSPFCEDNSRENIRWVENDFLACRDNAMEGPSSRGFELFSSSIVTRPEKTIHSGVSNDENLKSEPLELSLSLPNVLLPLPSHDPKVAPSSPSQARSVQSLPNTFHTSSDGFSGSMSFSGSQTFIHNPSCSLTQNSFENYEQSVGSHPLFQAIDQQVSHGTWLGQSLDEPKRVESPNYQRMLYGNGSHAPQTSQAFLYTQAMQGQPIKISEGSTGVPGGPGRQPSLHRQLSGIQSKKPIEVRSPTNSVGSHETRLEFGKERNRVVKERNGTLFRSSSQREMDQLRIAGTGFTERIISMIVSEPVLVMSRRIEEMAEHSIALLKQSACEILENKDKRGQLYAFRETLQNRSDLTVEILSKSHRAQLEILVAFKTGLREFLQRSSSRPLSDLAEIYLNLRCRNITCLSLLPVDECDCKVCVQKNGFCSACMCLICSNFDMALNTCSWVGCDVCLHWCHTECGLRESYIRNGRSVGEAQEETEMQFHCVACKHPSEMLGFVKEVFKTCAKDWKVETLSKELEYVKRIFSASNDTKGRQLHDFADQMITRLEVKSNLSEVFNYIMQFLTESNIEFGNPSQSSLKDLRHKNQGEQSNGISGNQVAIWPLSASTESTPRRDSASTAPPRLDWDQINGRPGNLELQASVGQQPVTDELESIVRIKHAEAKMFQSRADDARKEAEGLKRIAVAKNEKIDEEYLSRVTKLRMAEAEERRKQKLNELKIMEREHREYFSLKMRMESNIGDLLLKMEATKQKFSA